MSVPILQNAYSQSYFTELLEKNIESEHRFSQKLNIICFWSSSIYFPSLCEK